MLHAHVNMAGLVGEIEAIAIQEYSQYHNNQEHSSKEEMLQWYLQSPKSLVSLMILTFVSKHLPNLPNAKLFAVLKSSALKADTISGIIERFSENGLMTHEFKKLYPDQEFKKEFLEHCFTLAEITKSILTCNVNTLH